MSDQNFHEIQLSGKQLVFLFMCAVVLTVVVFLFGVSVGREVRSPSAQTASLAAPTDTTVPAEAPPPTQPAPNELSYAQALQGGREGGDPSKVTPPAPASEEPPPSAPVRKADKSVAAPPKKVDTPAPPTPVAALPAAAPATVAAPPPATIAAAPPKTTPAKKPVPALNGFFDQVAAFSTNDIADKEVAKLRDKGYPAFVFTDPANSLGTRFKVRVGPFAARREADQNLKSLTKEGYSKPFLVKG
jgi:cell division septation protein DedD